MATVASGLFIPHKYLLSKIIQNLNNSFGSSYTTICKQFCSGGWSSTNLGKRRLCKIYNSPFAITFTGKISLARDVGDKKASGLSYAPAEQPSYALASIPIFRRLFITRSTVGAHKTGWKRWKHRRHLFRPKGGYYEPFLQSPASSLHPASTTDLERNLDFR